jgi:hypothetical protein
MKPDNIKIHPTAMAFPTLPAKEMKELREDIQAHGIRVPLLFSKDGSVLIDGRNRWYVAHDLGIPAKDIPRELFKGKDEDIPAEIISRNLYRRHLNDKQRAALVVKLLAPAAEKEAKARQGGSFKDGKVEKGKNGKGERTVEKLAKTSKTSRTKIEQAMKVRKSEGDKGLDDIISGKADLTKKAKAAPRTRKPRKQKVVSDEERIWKKWSAFLQRFSPTERRLVKELVQKWTKPGAKENPF